MRVKVLVPHSQDFEKVVAEVNQFGVVYVKSKRRRFIATDEPPAQARKRLTKRGIEIVSDRRYDRD